MDRFVAGDPLRALAATSVAISHVGAAVLIASGVPLKGPEVAVVVDERFGWAAEPLLLAGGPGLLIFFCLSGYLIGRPFVRAFLAGRPLPALRPFARNRLLRIVPAFWFAVTLYLILYHRTGESLSGIATVYLFAQNYQSEFTPLATSIAHAWSIDVEMAFYVSLPLAAFAITRMTPPRLGHGGRLVIVLTLAVLGAAASYALLRSTASDSYAVHTLPQCLCYFLPGVVLAALEPFAVPYLRSRRCTRALSAGTLAAGLLTFVVIADYGDVVDHPEALDGTRVFVERLVLVFGPAFLVAWPLILQWGGERCPRVLDNPVLRWIGARSYSLYLLHTLPIYIFRDELAELADRGVWRMLAVATAVEFAVLLPLGALSYRFVEKPFLSLKRGRRSVSLRPVPASS